MGKIRSPLLILLIILLLPVFFSSKVFAATGINKEISFQGKVVNTNGTNVTDGNYDFEFKLYTLSVGGTAVWTETRTGGNQVNVSNGVFQVNLGAGTTFPDTVDFNTDNLYLSVNFNNNGEMNTRIRFTAVPYAFNALKVAGLTVSNTTGSLTIPNGKSIQFGDAFTTVGAYPLTINTSTTTDITLPVGGTLITDTASATQTITSTQTTGTVLGITDTTGLTGTIKGMSITLSGANAFDQTGLEFNLSNATGTNLYDIMGTGSTWKVTKGGALTVASCSGCGGAGGTLQQTYDSGGTGDQVITLDATQDSLIIRNPASSGSDSTFTFKIDQLNTGLDNTALFIDNRGIGAGFRVDDEAGDTSPFLIDSSGYVGIGTTLPSALLQLAGSTTARSSMNITSSATPPSSPNDGDIYFDTAKDSFLLYTGSKWQADRSSTTKIVAASDSMNKEKADYVADGTNDEVDIKAAIDSLPATGGKVVLLEGTFTISSTISIDDGSANDYVTLEGQGDSTVIKVATGHSTTLNMIDVYGTSAAVKNVTIKNLLLDGNSSNTSGTYYTGIRLKDATKGTVENVNLTNASGKSDGYGILIDGPLSTDVMIRGCRGGDFSANAVELRQGNRLSVIDNKFTSQRIEVYDTADAVDISNNYLFNTLISTGTNTGATTDGIKITNNYISTDNAQGASAIILDRLENAEVSGNTISFAIQSGIEARAGAKHVNIANNHLVLNAGASQVIYIDQADYVDITGNYIRKQIASGWYGGIATTTGSTYVNVNNNYLTSDIVEGYQMDINGTNINVDNNFLNNHASGISIGSGSTGVVLKNNTIRNTGSVEYDDQGTNTAILTFNNSGHLGIGTTNPLSELDVVGTASISGLLTLTGTRTLATTAMQALTLGDTNTGGITIAPNLGLTFGATTLGNNGSRNVTINAGTSGTTATLLVKLDTSGTVITADTSVLNSAVGVAIDTKTSGQAVRIAIDGVVTATADNTVTAGDYIGIGTTTPGRAKSLGTTYPSTSGIQVLGRALGGASEGSTFLLMLSGLDNNVSAGGAGPWTDGTGITYLTDTAEDFVLGASTVGNATFYVDVSEGIAYLGKNEAKNGGLTFYSTGVGETDPTISSNSSGDLVISATSGEVILGSGTGNITFALTGASDVISSTKTTTLAGAYTTTDFTYNRIFTGGANDQGGALFLIKDTSGGAGTINPDMLVVNSALTSGSFTGNLLRLQIGGGDKILVDSAGVIKTVGGQTADLTTLSSAAGTNLSILPSAPTSSNPGNMLVLKGGAATTSGNGGALTITGGAAAGTTTTGGALTFLSGAGGSGGAAGDINIDVGVSGSGNGTINLGSAGRIQNIAIGNTIGGTITIGKTTGSDLVLNDANWSIDGAGAAILASLSSAAATGLSINSGTTGALTIGDDASIETIDIGSGAAAKTINIGTTSGGTITIGKTTGSDLVLNDANWSIDGAGAAILASLSSAAATGLSINSGTTGALTIGDDASNESISIGTGNAVKTINIGSTNTTSTTTLHSGSGNINLISNNSGTGNVQIGDGGAASGTPDLLVLDIGSTEPSGIDGAMYYSTTLSKFRCYENSSWKNCDTTSASTPVMDLLAESTIGVGATAINLTVAAREYLDCHLSAKGLSGSGTTNVRFNNDAGSNYDYQLNYNIATAFAESQGQAATSIVMDVADTEAISVDLQITNFQDTDKTVISRATRVDRTTGPDNYFGDGFWRNTSNQITVVNFFASANNFLAGSHAWCQGRDVADYAENYYSKDTTIEAGDVVTHDPSLPAGIKKADKPYDQSLIGSVSTKPGIVLDEGIGFGKGWQYPIALSGRIPVKVTTLGGPIKTGDLLTSSTIPGVAMKATKAGAVIGQALEAFDGEGIGKVLVFVKTSYFNGVSSLDLLTANNDMLNPDSGTRNSTNILNFLVNEKVKYVDDAVLSEILTDRLITGLEVVTPKVITKDLEVSGDATFSGTLIADKIVARQIMGLEVFTDKISLLENRLEGILEAPPSPAAEVIGNTLTTNKGLVITENIRYKGSSFFEGLAQFIGNVIFRGDVTFFGRPTFNKDTAGLALIARDQKFVEVTFQKEYTTEPIVTVSVVLNKLDDSSFQKMVDTGFCTTQEGRELCQEKQAEYVFTNKMQYVVTREDKKGFALQLEKLAPFDITFSWHALTVNDGAKSVSDVPSLRIPFDGRFRITNKFGEQATAPDVIAEIKRLGLAGHDGVDFAMSTGTPLYAVDDGEVIPGETQNDYGKTVIISHKWGRSYYGHLSDIQVTTGQKIVKGDKIGLSGNSGLSTGDHLHFGIRLNTYDYNNGYFGKVDPLRYLDISPTNLPDLSFLEATISSSPITPTLTPTSTPIETILPIATPTVTPSSATQSAETIFLPLP